MNQLKKKIIKKSLICILAVVLVLIFGCPIKRVFGIHCPTCGTVHAIKALLNMDFNSYIVSNVFALPLSLVFIINIFNSEYFRITLIILLLNFVYYIGRFVL